MYAYIMPATAQNGTQISIEQARKQIRQEKTEIESNYKEQEALCLKKFIATPCIDAAKQQKTKSLVNVKQRELVLNDEERALKKAKIQSKQTQSSSKQPIQASDTEVNNDKRSNDLQVQKQQQKQTQARPILTTWFAPPWTRLLRPPPRPMWLPSAASRSKTSSSKRALT